ncbi:MAG: aminoacyl-histidine dipeptidase [Proteobacteria bacterium]|nr:aminoacyl-histidine dipeptidase [Pseudomonadota bacterium]MBU1739521.1 aminoacyl-histidine dipeptidase [Pseudomonadota bacterium]
MDLFHTALDYFAEISAVPRCSGAEERVRSFFCDWAVGQGYEYRIDRVGNLLIRVPASAGFERKDTIILQGHMDMVCEKNEGSNHDFSKDPIRLFTEGDWLKARGTTLGADNGIGLAIAMAVAVDKEAIRPPLELLFTVDEETGLTGASALTPDFFSGRILINLDSEDEGVFTVGCAGGRDSEIILPIEHEPAPGDSTFISIKVQGLAGGHSGVDINQQRANAIVVLAQLLNGLAGEMEFLLASISGGSAHNAIPREARVVLAISGPAEVAGEEIKRLAESVRGSYPNEPGLAITCENLSSLPKAVYAKASSAATCKLLAASPHGVIAMSAEVPGLVETSVNLATIREKEGGVALLFSQRSDREEGLRLVAAKLEDLSERAGASITTSTGYPGWRPDFNSELLSRSKGVYRKLFDREPKVEVIHAGLECGLIGAVAPEMDMISLGPTIENPHSPRERLHIPSVERIIRFLTTLLSAFCRE